MYYQETRSFEARRKEIEQQIVDLLQRGLRSGNVSADRTAEIARFIVAEILPDADIDQVYQVIQSLEFQELLPVVVNVVNNIEQRVKDKISPQADKLLSEG